VFGIVFGRVVALEHDPLIGNHPGRSVSSIRVDPPGVKRGLGSSDEECSGLMEPIESLKIQIAPIYDLTRSGLEHQKIGHLGVVNLAVGNIDKLRDCTPKIQKGVHLHRRLGGTKQRPGKQTHAQIDGARVQGVHSVLKVEPKLLACVDLAGFANQHGGQVCPDLPIPVLVGIRKRCASDRSPKPHAVEFARVGTKACLDIAKRLAPGQSRKGYYPKVLGCRQRSYSGVASVAIDNARKACPRNELHDLRKQRLANVHGNPPGLVSIPQSYPVLAVCRSNRHQTKLLSNPSPATVSQIRWYI